MTFVLRLFILFLTPKGLGIFRLCHLRWICLAKFSWLSADWALTLLPACTSVLGAGRGRWQSPPVQAPVPQSQQVPWGTPGAPAFLSTLVQKAGLEGGHALTGFEVPALDLACLTHQSVWVLVMG